MQDTCDEIMISLDFQIDQQTENKVKLNRAYSSFLLLLEWELKRFDMNIVKKCTLSNGGIPLIRDAFFLLNKRGSIPVMNKQGLSFLR